MRSFRGMMFTCAAAGAAAIIGLAAANEVSAATPMPVYNFCSASNCRDGATPLSPLSIDAIGNLYGTTEGSAENTQVVYKLTPGDGGYTESVLHHFCGSAKAKKCKMG